MIHGKFPTIADVAKALRDVNDNVEGECDVRLQVRHDENGMSWHVWWGLSDYDTDHRGVWGCGSVPGVINGKIISFNSKSMAREMIEQCKEMYASL